MSGGAGTPVEAYGPPRWPRGRGWGLGTLTSLQAYVLPSANHNQEPGASCCVYTQAPAGGTERPTRPPAPISPAATIF